MECTSKESKNILEKEKQKEQVSETKDSKSAAIFHPVLEDNEIKCPNN